MRTDVLTALLARPGRSDILDGAGPTVLALVVTQVARSWQDEAQTAQEQGKVRLHGARVGGKLASDSHD